MRLVPHILMLSMSLAACGAARDGLGYQALGPASRLATTPEGRGLVVVDCRLEERSLSGVERVRVAGAALLRIGGGERLYAAPSGDLLVFDDVPPGAWRLASVRGAAWRSSESASGRSRSVHDPRTYRVAPEEQAAMLQVESGQAVFLGRVTVANTRSQMEALFELTPSRAAERRAWQRLRDSFPDSPWAPVLGNRLSELQPDGPGTPRDPSL